MKKFKFIDITTSDVAFEAYGKDLNELFANSSLAMFEVMVNTRKIKPKVEREVKVRGTDLQSLMFNWLNELLIFYGAENLAFSKFEVKIDKKNLELEAKCYGEEINPEKHEARTEVKAATMHKMEIEKNEFWRARVILDI
ncbi:MAG: archease [Candidatus Aenigmarchaeota archaeon]|nr:archease [Candidatus Aenigmarchaeota archaeon]